MTPPTLIVRRTSRADAACTTLRLSQHLLDRIARETAGSRVQVIIELLRLSQKAARRSAVHSDPSSPRRAITIVMPADVKQFLASTTRSMCREAELRCLHSLDMLSTRKTPMVID